MYSSNNKLAFVFCGLGSNWIESGMGLYHTEPVYRATMDQCDSELAKHTGWSVINALKVNTKYE